MGEENGVFKTNNKRRRKKRKEPGTNKGFQPSRRLHLVMTKSKSTSRGGGGGAGGGKKDTQPGSLRTRGIKKKDARALRECLSRTFTSRRMPAFFFTGWGKRRCGLARCAAPGQRREGWSSGALASQPPKATNMSNVQCLRGTTHRRAFSLLEWESDAAK